MSKLQDYYENVYSKKQLDADLRRKNRLQFLFTKNTCNKKILDIGCGPGVDISFLLKDNEVHGIDISDVVLDIAKNEGFKYTYKLDLSDIEKLSFPDNSFDIVIANDILEHLFFPKKLLFEIHRILKDDGYAIISVPNHFYWKGRLKVLFGKGVIHPLHTESNEDDYFHIRFFTLSGFGKLLSETGFTIKEKFYNNFVDIPRGLPSFIDKIIAKKYPCLFSLYFTVKAVKDN